MKQLVFVAVLAALASSAMTLLGVHALLPGRPEASQPGPPSGSQVGLADVVKELAALRRELGEVLQNGLPQSSSSPVPSSVPSSRGAPIRTAEVPSNSHGALPPEPVLAPIRNSRLAEALEPVPESEGSLRMSKGAKGRWMLRSEREALEWFGAPDSVVVDERGIENWIYSDLKDSGIVGKGQVNLCVHDGRVVDIW